MGDPNWRYDFYADAGSIPRPTVHGYLSSEPSTLTTHPLRSSNNLGSGSSDYVQKDIISPHPGGYAVDAYNSFAVLPEPGIGGFTAEASNRSYLSPLQDPNLLCQRQGDAIGVNHSIPDVTKERPGSFRKAESLPLSAGESNILFVDGLPKNCSRREVGHLFRPFIGFRDIRVVHKEPRRSGDKAMVLCFVEFTDVKCALTALEALQGYKFDDKKTDSPVLKIQFAHFPFRLPSERAEHQFGRTS